MIAAQRERAVLWLAPALVLGAASWVAAPRDPPVWLAGLGVSLAAIGLWLVRTLWADASGSAVLRTLAQVCLWATLAVSIGASAAQIRTLSVAQTPYQARVGPVAVEGWVVANNANETGPRLRLLVNAIDGTDAPPRLVRLTVSEAGVLSPGRGARCFGILGPPAGPLAPGGYDFARRAYFEQLGATGFAFGRCRPVALEPPDSWLDRLTLRLAALRADVGAAIQSAAPGRGGAIAAALVSGDQSYVDAETMVALRDSGLGHLLSVSGVHMGVVGGLTFATLLWFFALIPPIALRWPVKKIAAVGALGVLAAYLVLSGSSVPAIRAFVMACVAFGAILLDRPAITMRGLALAVLIVVLLFPESVLEPGFQMSFAATMALAALFEARRGSAREPPLPTPGPIIGLLQASVRGIGGVLLISLVAGIATDPFAIYHFQRFSLYSLIANLIAAPIMTFLVAPAAGIAAVLAPFGLADAPLQFMAASLDLIVAVGATFGERPEAVRALPRPPDLAFLLCVFGLLWACLSVGWLRWLATLFLAASVLVYVTAPQPVAAFDANLRAIFLRNPSGNWSLIAAHGRSAYARERLGAMLGLTPREVDRLAPPESCDEQGCRWRHAELDILVLFGQSAEPCSADIVLASTDAATSACQAAYALGPTDLASRGGGFIYLENDRLTIVRAYGSQRRPWTTSLGDHE